LPQESEEGARRDDNEKKGTNNDGNAKDLVRATIGQEARRGVYKTYICMYMVVPPYGEEMFLPTTYYGMVPLLFFM
jgi:hypothetical protein